MIKENISIILKELPPGVELVVAAKGRDVRQIEEAFEAGIRIVGENYVQEAEQKVSILDRCLRWHFIGHLQKNKVKKAVKLFDMVETLDSLALAHLLDKECKKIGKIMPVLIEVNSAREPRKSGVLPDEVESLVEETSRLSNIAVSGLMTMGPWGDEPEGVRPFFKITKEIFNRIQFHCRNKREWKYLSMGMSDTYKIAIQEGANMVRIGTAIFGPIRHR